MLMEITPTEELKKEVEIAVKPQENEVVQIEKLAGKNVTEIMALDFSRLEEKQNLVKSIDQFGLNSLSASAGKNNLLQTTIGALADHDTKGGAVSSSLADLNREIKDLDPSFLDFTKEGVLGKIFNPVRRYFERFEKADDVIQNIITNLEKGKNTLHNDNITLEIEAAELREITATLRQEAELGVQMDEQITARLEYAKARNESPEKIQFINDEILFPLRQRLMDMQQMIVVNQQGMVALEVIKRNNKELIRGVNRAKTVTVTALKTAVMVASALYNQKIVLRKIELLNETTNQMIASTSKMLKEQGTTIQKQASSSSISPETLKQAFRDCLAAIDDISTFKQQALPQMQESIAVFRELAAEGEKEIALRLNREE